MIQEIFPHKFDNHYSGNLMPDDDSIVFHFQEGKVLSCSDSQNPFPKYSQIKIPDCLVYLFSVDERKYFLLLDTVAIPPENYSYREAKTIRHAENVVKLNVFVLFTALHLWKWYMNNRFCGFCGGDTVIDSQERALVCVHCRRKIYPRLNPAVIVGVTDGDRLLITRYARNKGVSYDALVAGFTEIGETLEETVEREVMEEVGLKVKNIRYYKSQPWGFSGGILAGFYCDTDGSSEINLDVSELSSAEWVQKSDIKGQPDNFSLTNEMMINFKNSESV